MSGEASQWLIYGSGSYILGVLLVTFIFNIPMNNRLESIASEGHEAAIYLYWTNTYLPRWTFWNYIRAIASIVSAVCFLKAVIILHLLT